MAKGKKGKTGGQNAPSYQGMAAQQGAAAPMGGNSPWGQMKAMGQDAMGRYGPQVAQMMGGMGNSMQGMGRPNYQGAAAPMGGPPQGLNPYQTKQIGRAMSNMDQQELANNPGFQQAMALRLGQAAAAPMTAQGRLGDKRFQQ